MRSRSMREQVLKSKLAVLDVVNRLLLDAITSVVPSEQGVIDCEAVS